MGGRLPSDSMPRKAQVTAALKQEAIEKRFMDFERHIIEGSSVHAAAEASGVSWRDGRAMAMRIAVARFGSPEQGQNLAERGAFLFDYYVRRLQEIDAEMAELRARRDAMPDSIDITPEWIRANAEMRALRAEQGACEERLAAVSARVPTLAEVREAARPLELAASPEELK